MKQVFRKSAMVGLAIAVAGVAVAMVAGGATARSTANVDICVLLPDTKSSVRWVQFDAPGWKKALDKAGVAYSITNALNDPQKMVSQADACLSAGAKVGRRHGHLAGHVDRDREEVREGGRVLDQLRPCGRRRAREGLRRVRRRASRGGPGEGHSQAAQGQVQAGGR